MTTPALFPVFLRLTDREVLVVGAGPVGEKKIEALVAEGARVRVVAKEATPRVHELAREGRVALATRPFASEDVDGVFFVVTATSDPEAQRAAFVAAEARRTFVLALDAPANGSAFAGAVVRKPPFLVAISSSGEAPALARLLREMIDDFLPDATWVLAATALRARWREERVPMGERFGELVRAFKAKAD